MENLVIFFILTDKKQTFIYSIEPSFHLTFKVQRFCGNHVCAAARFLCISAEIRTEIFSFGKFLCISAEIRTEIFSFGKTRKQTEKDKGRLSAIHGDYRRYLGVNISIPNQPTTPLQPINQNEIQKRIDLNNLDLKEMFPIGFQNLFHL